jgi:HEAT repeat protein
MRREKITGRREGRKVGEPEILFLSSFRPSRSFVLAPEAPMKMFQMLLVVAVVLLPALTRADESHVYTRKGELSPNTAAPTLEAMVEAIEHGSTQRLKATLEYGERVLCEACVPLLHGKLLSSGNPEVRELAAWWLRRQPFAAPLVLAKLRVTVKEDTNPERRARAAEALGEMMDPGSLPLLSDAAMADEDASVRAAGARALARLNSPAAAAVLGDVLADQATLVKIAALDVLITVGGFRDYELLVPLLGDADAGVRTRAARLCGEHRVVAAETALIAMLKGDEASSARKAAAWALGRIGAAKGREALLAAAKQEKNEQVLDAIEIAGRMPGRS